jgi:2-dehydropantoate 2-reductase
MTSGPARIVVAGAGAVGSVVGGMLSARGHDVLLVGRDPHMAAVARDGLRVTGLFGEHHGAPRTTTELGSADEPADVVLVSVKSHATEQVARTLAGLRNVPPLVVSLQNGLGNVETLAAALGSDRVLGARVIFGALVRAPGVAHVTVNARPVAIGPLHEDAQLAERAGVIAALGDHPVAGLVKAHNA